MNIIIEQILRAHTQSNKQTNNITSPSAFQRSFSKPLAIFIRLTNSERGCVEPKLLLLLLLYGKRNVGHTIREVNEFKMWYRAISSNGFESRLNKRHSGLLGTLTKEGNFIKISSPKKLRIRVDECVYVRVLCHLTVAIYRDAPKCQDKSYDVAFVVCLFVRFLLFDRKRTTYKLRRTHTRIHTHLPNSNANRWCLPPIKPNSQSETSERANERTNEFIKFTQCACVCTRKFEIPSGFW